MINDKIDIVLNGKKYQARMDFMCLANTQFYLENEKGKFYTVPQLFKRLTEDDLTVIAAILTESVLRIHPQLSKEAIWDNLKYAEINTIREAIGELIKASMPQNKDDDKKKE